MSSPRTPLIQGRTVGGMPRWGPLRPTAGLPCHPIALQPAASARCVCSTSTYTQTLNPAPTPKCAGLSPVLSTQPNGTAQLVAVLWEPATLASASCGNQRPLRRRAALGVGSGPNSPHSGSPEGTAPPPPCEPSTTSNRACQRVSWSVEPGPSSSNCASVHTVLSPACATCTSLHCLASHLKGGSRPHAVVGPATTSASSCNAPL